MQSLLAATPLGRSRVVLLHGRGGQTDVVVGLRREVAEAGGLVVEGSCAAGPDGPFRPFFQVARALSHGAEPADREAVAPLLTGALDAAASQTRALLEQVRVRDGRLNHMESVRRALCAVASRRRTVIVVHDVQSADDDTVALIEYLIDDAAPAGGVIGTRAPSRPELILTLNDDSPRGRVLAGRLRGHTAVAPVEVGRMDRDDVSALLAEPAITDKLLRVSDGLSHRLRALIEALPDDLGALVDARLGALGHDALSALTAARLFDAPLTSAALADLSGVSRLVIQRLRADGFLAEVPVDGEVRVQVAEAFADSVRLDPEPDVAAWIHARAAELLEAASTEANSERIARHRLAANDAPGAVNAALTAARWLSAGSGMQRATELLSDVLEAAPDHAARLVPALVDLDVAMGRFDRALERCSMLQSTDLSLSLRQAKIHSLSGDMDAAVSSLESLRDAGLPEPLAEVADAQLADVFLRRGALEASETLCRRRLDAGVVDPLVGLNLRHTLAKIDFWRADFEAAEAAYQGVMDGLRQERIDDRAARRLEALVLHNLGLVSLRNGRYQEAIDRIQEALGLLEALGEHFEAAVCGHNLGLAHEYCQRYSMAISLFEHGIEVLERFGNRVNLTGAVNSLGDLYLTLGEHWRARKLLEYSLSLAEENGNDYFVAFNRVRLSRLERGEGNLDAAEALAQQAVESFESLGHGEELAEARLALAEAAFARSQRAAARAHLRDIERASDEVTARATILLARLEADPTRAHSLALSAVEMLRGLGQRDGVVEALTVAATSARAGSQAGEHSRLLDEAERVLTELRDRVPTDHREAFDALPLVVGVAEARRQPQPSIVTKAPAAPTTTGQARERTSFHGMVGASRPMLRVFDMIERLADCEAPILIVGESGTGKERVAEAIRAESARADKPFVRVNAAAFAETLLESELFGHEKGAFTGAVARKLGAFEQADGGTLFLDEIGDISPKTQVSLLRVLQEQEFRRVGGRKPIKVDVRILCATNRPLEQMVEEGSFRLDLYYRIKGLTVDLPALRDRGDDLTLLADAILDDLADKHGNRLRLSHEAVRLLGRYRWPGNVRELENVLRSAYFFAQNDTITDDDLRNYTLLREARPMDMGGRPAGGEDTPLQPGFDLNEAKRELEIRCIKKALKQTDGNITQAAKLLGMKRPRLSQKIKEYRLK